MTCRPGHAPKHPDFAEGNTMALRHGAYSVQAIADKAVEVHNELLRVAPWLDEERYAPSLLRYLQAAAREALAHRALTNNPKFNARLLEACTAASRLAWSFADELGLTPAGHARLKVLLADAVSAEVSVAELAARGKAIRERRLTEMSRETAEIRAQSGAIDLDGSVVVPDVIEATGEDLEALP